MTQGELWNWMMDGNAVHEHRTATAVLAREIHVNRWNGHGKPDTREVWTKGLRVNVVMASCFGDVGITDDLHADYGYQHRTQCVEASLCGGTYSPDNLLEEITPTPALTPKPAT